MNKNASTSDLLKWIAGAALLGGAARGVYHLQRKISPKKTLRPDHDLYDPEVELPVRMTPAQFERFQELYKDKTASAWNPTLYALGGLGGGVAGWRLTSALIHRARKRRLDRELEDARKRLDRLSGFEPPAEEKQARVWHWLDKQAEVKTAISAGGAWSAVRSLLSRGAQAVSSGAQAVGNSRVGQAVSRGAQAVSSGAQAVGNSPVGRATSFTVKQNPYASAGVGLAGALTAGAALPGVRSVGDIGGGVASGLARGATRVVGSPLRNALIYTLGPVAALSLLVGLGQGAQRGKKTQTSADLATFRRRVREEEGRATPHFRPRPVITESEEKTPDRGPRRLGVNQEYAEADKEQDDD